MRDYYATRIDGELWVFDKLNEDAPMCIERDQYGYEVYCYGHAYAATLDEAVELHRAQEAAYMEHQFRDMMGEL